MRNLLALAICCGLVAAASATTVYSTGFEAPTFAAGQLSGQDGWTTDDSSGAGVVQSSVVYAGQQAVAIDSSTVASTSWWWNSGTAFNPIAANEPLVSVDVAMMVSDSPGDESGSWGLDLYDSNVDRVAMWYIDDLGSLYAWDNVADTALDTGVMVPRGQWNVFSLRMNYATGTYTLLMDGAQVGGTYAMASTLDLSDADFRVSGPWYDTAYFDNYSITATPEPAAFALLGLGLALLRRR